jgi:sporulation protein YlmC with PRC-barrel domain
MKFEGKLEGREILPRAARIGVAYDAMVRIATGAVEAQILNVSSKGFRFHSEAAFAPGTEVTIEVDKLEPVKGLIRWSCGDEAGGVFLEAIAL